MNLLDQLKKHTTVVADTGEFEAIAQYQPTDATTNPSLIYAASKSSHYSYLIDESIDQANKQSSLPQEAVKIASDLVIVNFAKNILDIIPGRVSIEVDARLSFDTELSVAKALSLIEKIENLGISKDRILIKLTATWEGICAAKILEKMGIHCNMTLIFNHYQAIACGQAGVTLISPFVGRIFDWYKKSLNVTSFLPHEDPGVLSVSKIYNYYKKFGIKTQVMGASFRNIEEIIELTGCDLLTISPNLLDELKSAEGNLTKKLDPEIAQNLSIEEECIHESHFRYLLNQDPMATEKLSEGIRKFVIDMEKLEQLLLDKVQKTTILA